MSGVLLASALAGQGRRVLLLDGDQNLANLHKLLGVGPTTRVESLLRGEIAAPDLVQPIAPNLWLLPGESGTESLYGLDRHRERCPRGDHAPVRFPRDLLEAIQATQVADTLKTTILDRLDLPETARSVG